MCGRNFSLICCSLLSTHHTTKNPFIAARAPTTTYAQHQQMKAVWEILQAVLQVTVKYRALLGLQEMNHVHLGAEIIWHTWQNFSFCPSTEVSSAHTCSARLRHSPYCLLLACEPSSRHETIHHCSPCVCIADVFQTGCNFSFAYTFCLPCLRHLFVCFENFFKQLLPFDKLVERSPPIDKRPSL